jgi:hypothetical protein
VGLFAHKSVGKSAHSRERWVIQREIMLGGLLRLGWGESYYSYCSPHQDLCDTHSKQGESPFTAKIWPFIRRLSASQTSEHFLPEIKDVAFCMKIPKKV